MTLPVNVVDEGFDLYDGLADFFDDIVEFEGKKSRMEVTLVDLPPILHIPLQVRAAFPGFSFVRLTLRRREYSSTVILYSPTSATHTSSSARRCIWTASWTAPRLIYENVLRRYTRSWQRAEIACVHSRRARCVGICVSWCCV